MAKAGPAAPAEKQLIELLLAEPGLIATAALRVGPDRIAHTGLRRILTELYAIHLTGTVAHLDALRTRLADRPDLFDVAAERLLPVGQHMRDREQWLARLLDWFAERDIRPSDPAELSLALRARRFPPRSG
jgi:DNA primase